MRTPSYNRILVTQFRSENNNLRVEVGRRRKESRQDRICKMCLTGEVEDETHVILKCYTYDKFREKMFEDIQRLTNFDFVSMEHDPSWIIETILGAGLSRDEDRRVVFRCLGIFLEKAMRLRLEWLDGL